MYIVADIGGTKTRIARSDDLEKLAEPIIVETPKQYDEGIAQIIETSKTIAAGDAITAMALDITGLISEDGKIPLTAPHLPDWRGKPLAREIEATLSTRVHLSNDTAPGGP